MSKELEDNLIDVSAVETPEDISLRRCIQEITEVKVLLYQVLHELETLIKILYGVDKRKRSRKRK